MRIKTPIKIGIYKITSPTNKIYIGQSWDLNKRKNKYKTCLDKRQRYIYASIQKYGFQSHKWEIIHELPLDTTQEVMDRYEILYWEQHKSCGFEMMNIREPGRGGRNSEETKQKMKENNWNAKHKGELSSSWGKKHTAEHIAASHKKGKDNPMFGRKGKLHPRYGIPQPESFKEKIRRKVINTLTNEIYDSVTIAEATLRLKPASLRYHLKKNKPNIHNVYYLDNIKTKQFLNQ